MAIVKIRFVQHVKNTLTYIMKDRSPNDVVSSKDCRSDTAAQEFEHIRNSHRGKGEVQGVHLIQSWNESESKKFEPQKFHEMGEKLVQGYFPGHGYVIATHTNTGKIHNHIVVNPWNTTTGKKIENKKFHLYKLRDLNDEISKSFGLSVINGEAKAREARLPDKVQRMNRFNGRSYLLDIMQKADFARAYSTNYDQYVAILGELNVNTAVQNENITYFYPGKDRGKRGSKLGNLYDKEGLDKAFLLNKEKFEKQPELFSLIRSNINQIKDDPGNIQPLGKKLETDTQGHFKLGYRDLKIFDKGSITSDRFVHPSEKELKGSILPIDEMIKARRSSILEYCQKNNITLEKHSDSQWRLKDRPYVLMSDYEWTNNKNRTRGSLIDFVAAHKNITFLQAISHINQNPRLLLLEKEFGVTKRTFTSFYIPKNETMELSKALGKVGHWLHSFGASDRSANSLLSGKHVQVHQAGALRIFSEKDESAAFEFHMDGDAHWKSKKLGEFQFPFIAKPGPGKKAVVFLDPFSALKQKDLDLFSDRKHDHSLIVLMEPNSKVLHQFLGQNPQIQQLQLVPSKGAKPQQMEIDFFHTLKAQSKSLGMNVEWASEKSLSKSGHDLSGFDS